MHRPPQLPVSQGNSARSTDRPRSSPSNYRLQVITKSVAPQRRPALQARGVVDDADVGIERERDLLGVAAADIEVIEVGQPAHVGDRLLDPFVPAHRANLLARGVAELLVVGLALAERMMRELEMRPHPAVLVEAGAEAG